MRTSHDDLTHPVPPMAYIRWKENYFFVILCREQGVYGVAHVNCEPGFERTRMTCSLDVGGRHYHYKNETPIQDNFGHNSEITDGTMTVSIVKSHGQIGLKLATETFSVDLDFSERMPSFDYGACRYGAPGNYSFKEAMTFGTNLPFEHIQQAMMITGTVSLHDQDKTIALDGYGYRDHSWGMRTDNAVAWHIWTGLNFPDIAFGVMSLEILHRPGIVAKEGYVADKDGVRVLSGIQIRQEDRGADGLPAHVIFDLTDVHGKTYQITADVSGRLGQVDHENEKANKPSGKVGYSMTENFCPLRLAAGAPDGGSLEGFGLVELGFTQVPTAPKTAELLENA